MHPLVRSRVGCAGLLVVLCCQPLLSYSVLTHEAIIDTAWDQSIKPVLLQRFPQATAADLMEAHGYAYAGCIVQDMGYYPKGKVFFSDLIHYLRSGDFVVNLVEESQTLNELAFALGAMAHYTADSQGHPIAVNRSVALEYPRLERKYGREVTYADDRLTHLKVEFSFDVLQVARGNYAPQSYHDFIGFHVPRAVLERAFRDTYSLELSDVFDDLDEAFGTFRHIVSKTIPEATRVAWKLKGKELRQARPGITRRAFVYNLSKASYRKEWDDTYRRPGFGSAVLAFVIRIIPKFGPLKALEFRVPTPQTERLFEDSFDRTLTEYRRLLASVRSNRLKLENLDLDTGKPTQPTEYQLADKTYAALAIELAKEPPERIDPKIRANVLEYYRNLDLPFYTKRHSKDWERTLDALATLKAAPSENAPAQSGH
jgi:zinc dependent phospholipase C